MSSSTMPLTLASTSWTQQVRGAGCGCISGLPCLLVWTHWLSCRQLQEAVITSWLILGTQSI